MDKETEAKRDNKEHVYFKVLLKNITYTTKSYLKYVYTHIHIYLHKYRWPLRSYS